MAKGSLKIARRYAKALSELYSVNELEAVQKALSEFASTWVKNPALSDAMTNPAFKMNDRINAAREISLRIKNNDQKFANFICLLCQSGRLMEIEVMAEAFNSIVDQIKKLLSLKVTSAFEISEQEKENFKNHIHKEFGSMASVSWNMDTGLIGGLKIRAGDKLLDGSIRGTLQRLENSLLA